MASTMQDSGRDGRQRPSEGAMDISTSLTAACRAIAYAAAMIVYMRAV